MKKLIFITPLILALTGAVYSQTAAIQVDRTDGSIAAPSAIDWSAATSSTVTWPVFDDSNIPSGITRDTEWDTLAEINAATTDDDAVGFLDIDE